LAVEIRSNLVFRIADATADSRAAETAALTLAADGVGRAAERIGDLFFRHQPR
jgi:hypothetical protein